MLAGGCANYDSNDRAPPVFALYVVTIYGIS